MLNFHFHIFCISSLSILILCSEPCLASKCLEFKLGSYYSSGMVLQSAAVTRGANIWGWGCAGAMVSVSGVDTRVHSTGWWSAVVQLAPGGPYNITVTQTPAAGGQKDTIKLDNILAGDVWMCVGSDDMALPMSSVNNSMGEINSSLTITNIRFAEVKTAWTEEPQLELIGGLSIPWTSPTRNTLSRFSSTCWMLGRELLNSSKETTPIGLVGVYVNNTDIWSWAPREAVMSPCSRESRRNHTDSSGYWNGMLSPLSNMSVAGAVLYEGVRDVERDINCTMYRCLLHQTMSQWFENQKMNKFALIGLDNNNGGGGNNLTWAQLRFSQYETLFPPANLGEYIPGTSVVPSYDLADPGHFVSRYKQELARRIVQMTSSKAPIPPVIQKACYVYIYIALMMSEQVTETKGYSSQGFSSCCKPYNSQDNGTCLDSGPNGNLGILTSTNGGYLFAQECKTYSGEAGLVTEIFYGWVGGYPYLKSPLYGSASHLPATSSWVKVVHDDHDPMCVH